MLSPSRLPCQPAAALLPPKPPCLTTRLPQPWAQLSSTCCVIGAGGSGRAVLMEPSEASLPAAVWPRWWTVLPNSDFLSRPDGLLFSSRLLSPLSLQDRPGLAAVHADRQRWSGKGAGGRGGKGCREKEEEEEGDDLSCCYYRPDVYCCTKLICLNPLEAGDTEDYQTDKVKPLL